MKQYTHKDKKGQACVPKVATIGGYRELRNK